MGEEEQRALRCGRRNVIAGALGGCQPSDMCIEYLATSGQIASADKHEADFTCRVGPWR